MAHPRRMGERKGWAFTLAEMILRPLLAMFTRPRWVDGLKLPATGGLVLVANHVSHADPLTYAHVVFDHGRLPRFLAKASLFEVPFVATILRATGQIPVYRLSVDASKAFSAAVSAVQEGKVVVVYPEGTLTRDPDMWPMVGKTGAARIALTANVPVIPSAQWGAQRILPPYSKRPHLLPRHEVWAKVGDPVDLDDLRGRDLTPAVLREATDRIMDAVTGLLADLRGEEPPAERYDPRRTGVRPVGNPNARDPSPRRRWRRRR